MLATATVTKIDCNFVHEVYQYLYNRRYSLEICPDAAIAAFLLHLRAHNDCLTFEDECDLESLSLTDYSLDCNTSATAACGTVGTITITTSNPACVYSTAIENPSNGTGYPYVDLQNDNVYHKGRTTLHVTSSCGDYNNIIPVETGTVLIGASTTTSTDYDFAIHARHDVDNVTSLTNSYIKSLRLYHTDSSGALVNTSTDVDLDPNTTPYLSCAGCTTVTASDLYFGAANYTTALYNLIRNAVRVLSGDANNISVLVQPINATGYSVITRSKHNPASTFYGVKHTDAKLIWRNDDANTPTNVTQTTIGKTWNNAAIYYTTTINDLCSPLTLTMPNRFYGLSVNWNGTDFNVITLNSPYSTKYSILNDPHTVTCPQFQATAVVSPTPVSIVWKDASLVTVSTTDTLTTFEPGTYTVTATFADGCSVSDSVTFS